MAKKVLLQLHGAGKVTRGWLGVAIQRLSPELLKAFSLDDTQGALVADVVTDGPADKAGLKRGDIIVAFNGQPVKESNELPRMVAAVAPDTKVEIDTIRGGKRLTISVMLGRMKDDEAKVAARMQPPDVEETLGLRVQAISPDIARALRLEGAEGVVVSQVESAGPASEAGIRRGDVVREINRQRITDMESYENATTQLDPDVPVLMLLERRGNGLYVAVRPRKAD
jgi:serine protease Do